jgi:hypothetical protein
MKYLYLVSILIALVSGVNAIELSAQVAPSHDWPYYLTPDGEMVYDIQNGVTWLADANLPARERFGLPFCDSSSTDPTELCMYASGSMNYTSALAWVAALNAHHYLGHSDWQLPTTPFTEPGPGCGAKGPPGNNFGFGCDANALGSLYYTALGFWDPNTAVPIPPSEIGPFRNFQPNHYWSSSPGGGLACNIDNFDFANGAQGGGCGQDFLDVIPMIEGKIPGEKPNYGRGLQVSFDRKTVYDPSAGVAGVGVTWLADANLAASNTFGLARCDTPTTPKPCIARDGSMDYDSAVQFIANMNAYDNGAGYLGQTNWQLPPVNASCPLYNCFDPGNPMGFLYYVQFRLSAGTPVVPTPDIAVGPFRHLQTSPYWSCQADRIQDPCEPETDGANGPGGAPAEWGFSFGDGFLGTSRLPDDHFVTAYFVGCDLPNANECVHVREPGPGKQ